MALVPFIERDDVVLTSHPFYMAETALGRVLNLHKVLAHSPRALEGYATLNLAFQEMQLPARLREIAYLRVAHLNNSVM